MTHEAQTKSALTVLPASAGHYPRANRVITDPLVPDCSASAKAAATAAAS
jgi:hypothetical protein